MPNLFPTEYWPELDTSSELLVGILRWMIELGRVDICTEVSLLSSHMALPRQGHLEATLHVMLYLSLHHNLRLCMDPTYLKIDSTQSKVVNLHMFVDSDHTGDQRTQ